MSSSTSLQEALGASTDEKGRLILGNPKQGCRHCGTVEIKVSTQNGQDTGKAAIYHAGTECCPDAITDQITWRAIELNRTKAQLGDEERALRELEDATTTAESHTKRDIARARANKAHKGLAAKRRDHYTPRMNELAKEINRLKRKRDGQ